MEMFSEEQVREFVYGNMEGFEEIETVTDYKSIYNDYAPATTICKRVSDGTFWAVDWQSDTSYYGRTGSLYEAQVPRQVEEATETVVTEYWKNV